MKKYEIHLDDWMRILAGDAPPAFYAELVVRAAFLFLLLILSMRLLGKRMAAQISRNELAALVSLAAAIGVPMLSPDRGLLPSVVIAIIVLLISKMFARMSFNHNMIEQLTIGDVSILIEDGVIKQKQAYKVHLPRERLMAQLRSNRIVHLGEVKRLYMESTGDFSLVKQPEPSPGLLSLPAGDNEFVEKMVRFTNETICLECGSHDIKENRCNHCGSKKFTKAVVAKS
jgi:uncharacterized membrane protein YcaP (DUF421 family)